MRIATTTSPISTCSIVNVACPLKKPAMATAMIGMTMKPPICCAVRASLTRALTMIPSRTLSRQMSGTRVTIATSQTSLKISRVRAGSAIAPLTRP